MRVTRLGWFGTRTDRFDETTAFFRDVLGLALERHDRGFAMFRLRGATDDLVEVFGTDDDSRSFQGTEGAVAFVVDDVEAARAELEAAGIEPIDPITRWSGLGWFHFRAPDGHVYALMEGSEPVP